MTRAQIISAAALVSALLVLGGVAGKFIEPLIAQQIESVAKPKFEELAQRLRSIETSQQGFAEDRARVDERLKTQEKLLTEQRDLSIKILQQMSRQQ